MEFFKVMIAVLAIRGGWSLVASPSAEDIHKIQSYDSLAKMNTQLYEQFKVANGKLIDINNNFLYQHYMKNVDPKEIQKSENEQQTPN